MQAQPKTNLPASILTSVMKIKAMIRTMIRAALISIGLIGFLSACSSTPNLIPNTGPDTLDVYEGHISSSGKQPRMYRQILDDRRDLAAYTRDVSNEINLKFPKLPNPELVMYVFPHFTPKNRPIPGYSTSFLMFEADQYALPGEIVPGVSPLGLQMRSQHD